MVKYKYLKNDIEKKELLKQSQITKKKEALQEIYDNLCKQIKNSNDQQKLYYIRKIINILEKYSKITDDDKKNAKELYKTNKNEFEKIYALDLNNGKIVKKEENKINQENSMGRRAFRICSYLLPLIYFTHYFYYYCKNE